MGRGALAENGSAELPDDGGRRSAGGLPVLAVGDGHVDAGVAVGDAEAAAVGGRRASGHYAEDRSAAPAPGECVAGARKVLQPETGVVGCRPLFIGARI